MERILSAVNYITFSASLTNPIPTDAEYRAHKRKIKKNRLYSLYCITVKIKTCYCCSPHLIWKFPIQILNFGEQSPLSYCAGIRKPVGDAFTQLNKKLSIRIIQTWNMLVTSATLPKSYSIIFRCSSRWHVMLVARSTERSTAITCSSNARMRIGKTFLVVLDDCTQPRSARIPGVYPGNK